MLPMIESFAPVSRTSRMPAPDDRDGSAANDLRALSARTAAFTAERGWARFHSPKNLAMALSVEAAELVELFQWRTERESDDLDEATLSRVSDEIADVQIYLLQIAARLDVDIGRAVLSKLEKNARKYPAP